MEMLKLALESGLPLVHVRTDDIINVEQVLSHLAGEPSKALTLPEKVNKMSDFKPFPEGRVFYTSTECKSLVPLYHYCVENEKTIVFINTEKSVLQFDGGMMFPPQELILELLSNVSDDPAHLLPSFGGLTLKDVGEIAKMTMTRDQKLTARGVAETRRGYNNLKGITQIDTDLSYYVCPPSLGKWLDDNTNFFINPMHPSLTPRGLLFDGPPGTGKTLASKHIASAFGVPLYRLDLGAMMGKYVGDSENNLNAALAQVDQVEPCVVILDEVEKLFKGNGDSGVTSRLLSQLLWWLQEHKSKVFTVMTTNAMKAIPEELYREGRIDATMQFLGIDGFAAGSDFAKGAFDSMLQTLGASADEASYKELTKRVKSMFHDGEPVPQSKITQTAYSYVREMMSALSKAEQSTQGEADEVAKAA